MTHDEAEEIYMAAQMGMNYPRELLPMAILILADEPEDAQQVSHEGKSK